ncbi:hypothetical protein P170DRAFT_105581 [Aspergillus steynii IBT 23096]|uniref:Zn(2)-C6 fungal-type domain-containing protein n=1 Tax=Aspergillus steynii IBT 23096 TaxID=1392250 RepID=A0A2I2GHW3_9EURO|nr:uncharacterized protein P170DRAFT_105581 [Aspergillus steynii IBT 23096]PLB52471.1 hypothetical protein P170DRAFT_105581 [Aspergillus steynii IBT 23096]
MPRTPDALRASSSSQSSPNSRCRTCKRCRTRKVKCDGHFPKCGACHAKRLVCDYPPDARTKTARSKRSSDVEGLQRQLRTLQEQVSGRSTHNSWMETLQPNNTLVNEPQGLATELAAESEPTPSKDVQQTTIFHGEQPQSPGLSCRHAGNTVAINADQASQQGGQQGVSCTTASHGEKAAFYGATSLHHDPLKNKHLRLKPLSDDQMQLLTEISRDRLVSYASAKRQEEIVLYNSPGILHNIDFDGVSPDTAMHLLDLHWNRQHLSYLQTYRPAIMDSLINGGPYVNKLLLNAIYFSIFPYSDRESLRADPEHPQSLGMKFYNRFKSLVSDYIDQPSIATAVAFLTCGSSLVPHGKQSAAWVFCGVGYRMIMDLGYHLEDPSPEFESGVRLAAIEIELRRRLYWGAFVTDKFQSLFQGRQPMLHSSSARISHEYLDTYEELELWSPYRDPLAQPLDASAPAYMPRPSYTLTTFEALRQLCEIACQIIDTFYSINSPGMPQEYLLQRRDEIRDQLQHWKDSLPHHLQFEPSIDPTPPPHQITPHTTHWALVILVEQAFLKPDHFQFNLDPSSELESKRMCIDAALKIWGLVQAYKNAFTLRRAQYGISYATYCAVLVLLHHTDQSSGDFADCIRFFWSALLEYQRGCSFGLKKPLKILRSLIHRLNGMSSGVSDQSDAGITAALDMNDMGPDFQSMLEPLARAEADAWVSSWLNTAPEEGCLVNETIFGLFMTE